MASTSVLVPGQPQVLSFAPDDSDFIDSDLERDPDDRKFEETILSKPHPSETLRDVQAPSSSAPSMDPAHTLIPISRRFWFTFFDEHGTPDEPWLNENMRDDSGKVRQFLPDENNSRPAYDEDEGPPEKLFWFRIDFDLMYMSFYEDWGPLNVAMFYRFCLHVHRLLTKYKADTHLVLYTTNKPHDKANVALLAALYSMIIDKVTPADAFHPISELEFMPFRDAGYGRPDFSLTIQDILYGTQRALSLNLLDLTTFNLDEYEWYELVQNGDWNWITPNFIAFASPNDREYVAALRANDGNPPERSASTRPNKTIAKTVSIFKERGIKLVVRLNNPLYDKAVFEDEGIQHEDMYFDDGSNPSEAILRRFIAKADEVISAGGVIAVHCKAGLGRTGVLIGAYLIWKHGFSASEIIGFMRLMRPGCVVGPQQHFMYENFAEWIRWGVRDSALKQAREVLAAERADMLRQGRLPHNEGRTSLKRPATPDNDEGDDSVDLPVTPRAKKIPHVVPATAAPGVKPTPCVGQPRKSPSPSRKRPAVMAPATVARLERTHSTYGGGITRGLLGMSIPLAPQFEQNGGKERSPPSSNQDGESAAEGGNTDTCEGMGEGNVLMEAQRHNIQAVHVPSSPKSALVQTTTISTPSPVARVKGHERSRSAVVLSQSVDLTPTSPKSATKEPTFRASPDIKTRYQLKDASRDLQPVSPRAEKMTDAEVLGAQPLPEAETKTQRPTVTRARSKTATASTTRVASQTTATRAATATGVRSRTPSSSATRPTTASTKLQDARSTLNRASVRAGTTKAETAVRARPGSTLTAPTAASAARAAANLKRPRVVSRDVRPTTGFLSSGYRSSSSSSTSTTRSVSGSSRIGRSVRRRRSSMGEADVDVVA